MRILVCGGRDYNDYQTFHRKLSEIISEFGKVEFSSLDGTPLVNGVEIISGMARGADSLAVDFANYYGLPIHKFPADWRTFGKSAGYIRNKQMLKEGKPDLVVAFPGGKGTENMVNISKKQGVEVRVVNGIK